MASMNSVVDVSVCICTYKRPQLLDALLTDIQKLDENGLSLEIVVADNDPGASASDVISSWGEESRFPLAAVHVPTPNISLARNACVQRAKGRWVAFIDDDEQPDPEWVKQLVHAAESCEADVVFGPVFPILPASTPSWIVTGDFFQRPRHPTGTKAASSDMRTGNALVRRTLLEKVRFDPDFGRAGGSDSILFSQLQADGRKMVWCDEAIVHEVVPPERANWKWLLRRSFRTGQSSMYARLQVRSPTDRWKERAYLASRASARLIGSMAGVVIFLPFSPPRAFRNLRNLARSAGTVLAALGYKYHEYSH